MNKKGDVIMVYLDYAANAPADEKVLNLFCDATNRYYANTNKFVSKKEVSDNYVSNINKIVNNRTNFSKMIVKSDYYRYLLK